MRKESYLAIASEHLGGLQKSYDSGRPWVGTDGVSSHFHEALVVIVFSAMALEYAIGELLSVRMLLQTPEPQRGIFRDSRLLRAQIPEKLRLLKSTTRIPDEVLNRVQDLFDYRNDLVHSQVTYTELPSGTPFANPDENRIELSDEARVELSFPGFRTDVLSKAEEFFGLATSVVASLESELRDPAWPPAVVDED